MPVRVGEMMVVVRAQDFASRTLHRVSGELAGMSRAQRLQIMGQTAAFNLSQAQARKTIATNNARRLSFVKNSTAMQQRLASEIKTLEKLRAARDAAAARRIDPTTGLVRKGVNPAFFKQIQGLNAAMETMAKRIDLTTDHVSRYQKVLNQMPSWLRRGATSALAFGDAQRKVASDLAAAEAGLNSAQRGMLAYQNAVANLRINRIQDFSHALSGVGRTMQLVGAIGTVAFGAAANAFANFNSKVTLAATQTRAVGASAATTAANATKLTKVIENQMRVFPASSGEMADAAYTIFSSIDVAFGQGTKLLKMFNQAAVAGGTDLATATNASITVLENFDTQLTEHGRITQTTTDLMDRMFAIVRYGRLNFLQLSQMLGQVVPAAVGAQQSFDSVSGALAFLTRTLGTKAGPSLGRLLEVFTNKDIQDGMQKAGARITDFNKRLLPFPKIIEQIARVAGNKAQLNDLLRVVSAVGRGGGRGREFTVQARRALIQLVTHIKEYRDVQGEVVSNNDEFRKSFEAMSQTMGVRWQVFLNQMKVLVLLIGEQAIPVFLKIGDTITKWIDKWKNLSDGTRRTIVQWATWISIGTLVAGVFASIAGAIGTLITSLVLLRSRFGPLTTNATSLLTALRGIAGIGAITIGIELIKKGGAWALLGGLFAGAGVGGLLRGRRGVIGGATVALGVEMKMKGSGWESRVGQILMGAGAGFAFGGPAGAAVGAAAAVIPIVIETQMETDALFKALYDFQQKFQHAATVLSAANPQTLASAQKQISNMLAARGIDISKKGGADAANAFLDAYVKTFVTSGGPRDASDALYKPVDKTKMSWKQMVNSVKPYTELLDIANSQMQHQADLTAEVARNITRAYNKKNFGAVNDMLRNYVKTKSVNVTTANVAKLVADAFNSGDVQAASGYLQEYMQNVEQGTQDLQRFAEEQKNYAQSVKDAQRDATQSTIDDLRSMYDRIYEMNKTAMGELGQGPWLTSQTFDLAKEWGIKPRAKDLLKDLRMQNSAFTNWNKDLRRLLKRGVSRSLIDEFRKMGPEAGQGLVDAMKKATPKEQKQIIAAWNTRNKNIKNQTKMDFKDEIERFRKAGLDMGTAIKEGFDSAETAKFFENWIKKTFPSVIDSAVASAMAEWRKGNPPPTRPNVVTAPPGTGGTATGSRTKSTGTAAKADPYAQFYKDFPALYKLSGFAYGMVQQGNLDLNRRKAVWDKQAKAYSSVRSMSFLQEDPTKKFYGKEILVPTAYGGKIHTDAQARARYYATGQQLGVFNTAAQATKYAKRLHQEQEGFYGKGGPGYAYAHGKPYDATGNSWTYNDNTYIYVETPKGGDSADTARKTAAAVKNAKRFAKPKMGAGGSIIPPMSQQMPQKKRPR